jgi:hypothetical protein
MADYAGAVAAMRDRFLTQWVDGSGARRTPVMLQNEPAKDEAGDVIAPWPPVDGSGRPIPWVYFEVIGNGSELRGAGLPGNQVWLYRGHIHVNVLVAEGFGIDVAQQLAVAAGEIFRAATFYRDGQGSKILTMSPETDGGGNDADNGNQFCVTCTVPFEFFLTK